MADENEPAIKELDDGWTPRGEQDTLPTITQGVLHGKPYRIRLDDTIFQERRVGIVAGRDGLNDVFFIAADGAPNIAPSDFPDAPLAQAGDLFDRAEEGSPSLRSVQKAGASTVFVDTDEAIRNRGGDPKFRIPKPDSSLRFKKS